jgi:glycosyltransferase involved in cell wall biosynthesis
VFVIATRGEGFPRVITEAMSQGLPVVATGIGTIRAMLADRTDALLVAPERPDELADAVEALLGDAPLRRTLVRNGYRFAEGQLGGERPAAQFLRLLAAHGPRPAPGAPAR